MGDQPRILICNCEKTMELDGKAIGEALGIGELPVYSNLCRRELSVFEQNAASGGSLVVGCTQEAPLFSEIIEEAADAPSATFVNIRERAGWSSEGEGAYAKMAALIEEAQLSVEPPRLKSIKSDGLCLVYGRGQEAFEAAKLLSPRLSVTLILSDAADVILPQVLDFAVYQGTLKSVRGALGSFSVEVDGYAPMVPSSRGAPEFIMAKDGAKSQCSLILDMSGNPPLVTGHEKRDGYMRVDAGDPAAVMRAVFDLSDMVGEFEKPVYVDYNAGICAHARNEKTGCSKCLDVCPAGAIAHAGEIVEIDPLICGGCGSCHAVCPTGAISYNYPTRHDLLERLFTLAETYGKSAKDAPLLLVHDDGFGTPIIDALARFGTGLPAHVIPFSVHSPTVFGHTEMMTAISAGFSGITFLCDAQKTDELTGLEAEIGIASALVDGLSQNAALSITTNPDPDALAEVLSGEKLAMRAAQRFAATGDKRAIARMAVTKLAEQTGATGPVALPENAPYGRVNIDLDACTLCMSCVSACPANAMLDTPDTPQLRFVEQACVQCSLCVKTCPENALTLQPQLDWTASAMQPITLKEEEPFECIACGKPFATKSTINRIIDQLGDKHSMFMGSDRIDLIKMCGDCRVEAQADTLSDPFSMGPRPKIRTTDDYIESDKQGLTVDDFLMKN